MSGLVLSWLYVVRRRIVRSHQWYFYFFWLWESTWYREIMYIFSDRAFGIKFSAIWLSPIFYLLAVPSYYWFWVAHSLWRLYGSITQLYHLMCSLSFETIQATLPHFWLYRAPVYKSICFTEHDFAQITL